MSGRGIILQSLSGRTAEGMILNLNRVLSEGFRDRYERTTTALGYIYALLEITLNYLF